MSKLSIRRADKALCHKNMLIYAVQSLAIVDQLDAAEADNVQNGDANLSLAIYLPFN